MEELGVVKPLVWFQSEIRRFQPAATALGGVLVGLLCLGILSACTSQAAGEVPVEEPQGAVRQMVEPVGGLTIYSAREESLVGPIIEEFKNLSGIDAGVKYGSNAALAATILEEGANSPADVFLSTDPGILGVMSDLFAHMPSRILNRVPTEVRSREGKWVGISGRARVIIYNTDRLKEEDLPESILGFTDPEWNGRMGWAPTNGSFHAFVTAFRTTHGEEAARQWLEGILANKPKAYPNNTSIVQAVGAGEVDVGFVNHYYLFRFLEEEGESFPARNYHPTSGDIGGVMLVNGAGILATSRNQQNAQRFVEFLLSPVGQQYFASQTFEYPMIEGVKTNRLLVPRGRLQLPDVDLSKLEDIKGTLTLLRQTGVLP